MHATVNPAKKSPPKLEYKRNRGDRREYGLWRQGEGGRRNRRETRTRTRNKQGSTLSQERSSSCASSNFLWVTLCPRDPKAVVNQLRIYPMHSFSKLWPGVRDERDGELTGVVAIYPRNSARALSQDRCMVDHGVA